MNSEVIGVLPGGGWMCTYTDSHGADTVAPVIGWVVHANGVTGALVFTDGMTREVFGSSLDGSPRSLLIWHPDGETRG